MRCRRVLLIGFLLLFAGTATVFGQEGQAGAAVGGGPAEAGQADEQERDYLHQSVYASAIVRDRWAAVEAISHWAEEHGGYFLVQTDSYVRVRFPGERIPDFRGWLDEYAEAVGEFSPSAQDLREELMGIESRIRSREEILQRNMEHLERAGVSGTLAIERELARLLGEIERLKGRLRRIRQDLRFARVEVDLNSPSRRPPDQMPSSFPWLGEVDMYGLLEETAEVVK